MYVIGYTALKLCLCVPVDPPDPEFDCVGLNGEGSYHTAVVGGVSDVGGNLYCCTSAQPNVPECASC